MYIPFTCKQNVHSSEPLFSVHCTCNGVCVCVCVRARASITFFIIMLLLPSYSPATTPLVIGILKSCISR